MIKKKILKYKKINNYKNINKKNFSYEKFKEKNFKKKLDIIIPDIKFNIEDISKLLKKPIKKIENIIKLLKLNEEEINQNQTILISDYLNIITKIKKPDILFKENLINKDIIISLIGNVDNGKSTLINQICNNKFEKEKLITQGIYINYINYLNNELIFIDTPGHKNLENFKYFSIEISNIIIIVINITDKLNNELINLIKIIEEKNIYVILNINKIDLVEPREIKKKEDELIKLKIDYKLNFMLSKTSSKTKSGLKELINLILNIKRDIKIKTNSNFFQGLIIDININENLEIITTVFIETGELNLKDIILSENNYCEIKELKNYKNEDILNSYKHNIVKIKGFKTIPNINSLLFKIPNKIIAEKLNKFRKYKNRMISADNKNLTQKEILALCQSTEKRKNLNLIIKSNSERLLESIKNLILNINTKNFKVNLVYLKTGEIKISDIKFAKHTKSNIISFNIRIGNKIKNLSKINNVNILQYKVIYDIVNYIKSLDSIKSGKILDENIIAIAKVNKIFNIDKKLIAGCIIIYGIAKIKSKIKIFRNKKLIYKGELESLKLSKLNVNEVIKHTECGIFIKEFKNYLENDIIKFYKNK